MINGLKSDLLAVQANVGDLELCSNILQKIAKWNVSISSDDRETIADLFYAVLKSIQLIGDESIIENYYEDALDAFENINLIAKTEKSNSSLVLIDFLNELYQHRNNLSSIIELPQNDLLVLLSDLEPIKFIFKICDSAGKRFFPINKLLGNIILDSTFINTKIEPYHINLIQLAVEMYRATCQDPTNQFELINKCNLKFIKYLDGACIRVDTKDMCNFRYNQVMVFCDIKNEKVLIRHEDKTYFDGVTSECEVESEYNAFNRPIGYFIELSINGKVIDYSDAIRESPKEFLRLLYEKNCKNILIEKMIIKTNEGRFEPLNPLCIKDKWIIKGRIDGREGKKCLPDQFVNCIEEGRLQLFSLCNTPSTINQVSFGLCMALLEHKQLSINDLFDGINDNDWIQNIIIKNWVTKSDDKLDSIEFALEKYFNDLDYCAKETDMEKIEFEKDRIRDSLPFSFQLKWIYEVLKLPEIPSVFLGTITAGNEDLYIIDFSPWANRTLAKINSKDITYISSTDVILSDETDFESFYVDGGQRYFVYNNGFWYGSSEMQNIYKLISQIELINSRMLDYEMSKEIHENAFEKIKSAMLMHSRELADISIKKINIDSLIKIRLINNLVFNKINSSSWKYYYNLFAKQQILSFEGIEHNDFFSKREQDVVVVPKDRSQEDAVLRKVYETYIRVNAKRDLDWWYSGDGLSVKENKYCINGIEIKKVRFLFDNTEYGTATIRTIAAKLGKIDEWIQFELTRTKQTEKILRKKIEKESTRIQQYTCNDKLVSLMEMIDNNQPIIESCSYYGTNDGDTLIKNFLISCGIEESKINVYHDKEIKNKASLVREECEKLGIKYNDKIYIVIREFNMPKKYLLPAGAVGNANRIVTLLVQKLEV